jgi:hypothetical protein
MSFTYGTFKYNLSSNCDLGLRFNLASAKYMDNPLASVLLRQLTFVHYDKSTGNLITALLE